MNIEVTPSASIKMLQILSDANMQASFLRVGVSEGGCAGLSYTLVVDDQQTGEDIVFAQRWIRHHGSQAQRSLY